MPVRYQRNPQLLSTKPTTLAGVSAVMEHLALDEYPDDTTGRDPQEESILHAAFNYGHEGLGGTARAFPTMIAAVVRAIATGRDA